MIIQSILLNIRGVIKMKQRIKDEISLIIFRLIKMLIRYLKFINSRCVDLRYLKVLIEDELKNYLW